MLLRSLQQALYSPDNVGHFGLAYEAYTHFTSPIRRYPDLLVHRAIKAVLAGKSYSRRATGSELGLHCSATERRADEATRDVETWLKCYLHAGPHRRGVCRHDRGGHRLRHLRRARRVYVEGLVHVTELGDDYFQFDAVRHQMLGERTGQRFRLGDRVRVKLVRVDLETSKIDFVLAEESAPKKKRT